MALRRSRRRCGAAVVEMAIVGPIALLFLIGILDVGLAVWSYNVTAAAAREGARYAVVHGSKSPKPAGPKANDPDVEAVVRKYTFNLAQNNIQVTSTWPDGNDGPNHQVTVGVTYTFKPAAFLQLKTLSLQSSTTMTICH